MPSHPEIDGRPVVLAAGSMLDHDAPTLIRAAATAGFDAFGLRLSGEHSLPSLDLAVELKRMAADLGLRVHDVEVIRIDASWPADGHPPDAAKALVEAAAAVGAAGVLVVSDHPDSAATSHAVAGLVDLASEFGLTIGLEYMAWTTPATPSDALAMAEATGSRVIVDVLHHHRVGAGVDELTSLFAADRLAWVQICDAADADVLDLHDFDRSEIIHEARHGRLPPGQGVLPLADILAAIPIRTSISVEVQSDGLLALGADDRARLLATSTRSVLAHTNPTNP